jgi:hypothetical protein
MGLRLRVRIVRHPRREEVREDPRYHEEMQDTYFRRVGSVYPTKIRSIWLSNIRNLPSFEMFITMRFL